MPQTPADLAKQFGGMPVSDLAKQFGGSPVASDTPSHSTTQAPQTASQPSWLARNLDAALGAPGATEVLKGGVKSVLGAIEGGGRLVRKAIPALDALPSVTLPVSTTPSNTAQSIGKTAGNIGMFFAPGGTLTRGKAALATGKTILDTLIGAAAEGASAWGVTALQTGDAKAAMTTGAVTGAMSAAAPVVAPGAKWLGERIETALVKPSAADIADGFKASNVFKHDLGGTLRQTFDKTEQKLNDLSGRLKTILSSAPNAKIDVLDAMTSADTTMRQMAEQSKSGLSYAELKRASDTLLEKLEPLLQGAGGQSAVNLQKANDAKQIVGDIGAFTHGLSGKVAWGADANALEQAANTLYGELKTRIEQAASGPVADVNRQMGDILGVRRAVIRRIPVAERANLIGLTDALSVVKGGPAGVALSIANHILRSGPVANALVKGAESSTAGPLAARTIGALTGIVQ